MINSYVVNDYEIATLIIGLCGIVFFGIGVPLFMQIVKPNWVYGCRTRKTLSNDELWYKVNRRGGRNFMIAGIVTTKSAALLYLFKPHWSEDLYLAVLIGAMLLSMAFATIDTFRYESREWKGMRAA